MDNPPDRRAGAPDCVQRPGGPGATTRRTCRQQPADLVPDPADLLQHPMEFLQQPSDLYQHPMDLLLQRAYSQVIERRWHRRQSTGQSARVGAAHGEGDVYLANAGVLVTLSDTTVVFDPLFRNDFGQYRLVPPQTERALFKGTAPVDALDIVFVSHSGEHGRNRTVNQTGVGRGSALAARPS